MLPCFKCRFFRFLPSGASRNITLKACNCWVAAGGKNATGVRPAGTSPAAIAWILPAVCAAVEEKTEPPPTKE